MVKTWASFGNWCLQGEKGLAKQYTNISPKVVRLDWGVLGEVASSASLGTACQYLPSLAEVPANGRTGTRRLEATVISLHPVSHRGTLHTLRACSAKMEEVATVPL